MGINVLVFGMTDNPGGMESCVMNYYRNIDKNEVHFDFLCNWEHMVYADEVMADGSRIYTIPKRSDDYKAYKEKMDEFFEKHAKDYDVLWYNTCTLTNIDYLVYAKKYGIKKRIIHSHNSGNETSKLRGMLHYINKMRLSMYATDYWSCSMPASKYFFSNRIINSTRHHIINNAIQLQHFQYDEEKRKELRDKYNLNNKNVIGHIGRFQPQKNQEFLVEIFSRYLKQDNNAILMLIGQGENEDKVKQRISELGINDKVMLMGVRQDVNELLQAMDVFVLPSLFEGLGMVLIEAQAAGLPCVTSKDVVPDIVNVTGNVSFVPLNNNADEWAQKIYDTLQKTYERNKSISMLTEAGYDIARETDRFAEYISE